MKGKQEILGISLTGGLGNQLFQLAAALNLSGDSNVEVFSGFGSPRLNELGKPEIQSFILPNRVVWNSRTPSRLLRQGIGHALRVGISPRKWERFTFYKSLISIINSALLFLFMHQSRKVYAMQNVGYAHIKKIKSNTLIVGYFQSFKWVNSARTLREMQSLQLVQSSSAFEKIVHKIRNSRSLIVHIRLGDYLNEKNFGIPSREYFINSIHEMIEHEDIEAVWIFSDEIDRAKKYLRLKIDKPVTWVESIDNSTSATFEAMRYGLAYVISNSSFSWWTAMLSYNENVPVIAPEPWFIAPPTPDQIIPPHWRIRSR